MNRSKALIFFCVMTCVASLIYIYERPLPLDLKLWSDSRNERDYHTCYRMRWAIIEMIQSRPFSAQQLVDALGEPDYKITPNLWRYKLRGSLLRPFPGEVFLAVEIFDNKVTRIFLNEG